MDVEILVNLTLEQLAVQFPNLIEKFHENVSISKSFDIL